MKPKFLLLLLAPSFGACAYSGVDNPRLATPFTSTPTIKNEFARDSALAGAEVNQFTTNLPPGYVDLGYDIYNRKHPAEVVYYFWDGRLLDLNYSPNGKVIRKQTTTSVPRGSPLLDFIDFTYGSDPRFTRHTDPRRPLKPWKNLYQKDPRLAAIEIDQEPREGNAYQDKTRYDHRHPAEVDYFFWDGRNRWITYTPYGDITEDSLQQRMKPGDAYWNDPNVDFNYGSDPHFKTHKDPRRHNGRESRGIPN